MKLHNNTGDLIRVSVADNKYEVIQDCDGRLYATRHGYAWRELSGDKLVLCLATELDEARKEIKSLKAQQKP